MALAFLRKIQKILEKPQPPAYIRERDIRVVIPWYERFWREIRPPAPVGSAEPALNTSQLKLVWATLVVVVVGGVVAWTVRHFSAAPSRAQVQYEQGMTLLNPLNFQEAVDKFSESIQIRETAPAYLARGSAYSNLGKAKDALADWDRALQLDPTLAAAYVARGTHFRLEGDLTKALADLDKALQIEGTIDGYFQRGQVYHSLREYAKAVSDYNDAIALRPEEPYVYLARALSRSALGDEEGAAQDRARAQRLQAPESGR